MNIVLLKKISVIVFISLVYILVSKKVYYHLENKSEIFYNNVKLKQKSKIYDIIHHNLPSMRNLYTIANIFPFILLGVAAFIDLKLLYIILGFLVPILIFRLFMINITILPKDKKCDIKKNSCVYTGGCYDKVYSGHFAVIFTSLLVLYTNKYIDIFTLTALSTISGLLIITSRSHYTIDIFVSFLVVIVAYQNNINVCRIIDKFIK
jgi:hypothetical protein